MFLQAGQQFGKITGAVTNIQLILEDMIPAIPAGPRRTRQGKQIGSTRHPGRGAGLDRRGADKFETDLAENFTKSGNLFFIDLCEGFRGDIPARDPGAARGNDRLYRRIRDPGV